jgi:hypothetical protein
MFWAPSSIGVRAMRSDPLHVGKKGSTAGAYFSFYIKDVLVSLSSSSQPE